MKVSRNILGRREEEILQAARRKNFKRGEKVLAGDKRGTIDHVDQHGNVHVMIHGRGDAFAHKFHPDLVTRL